MSRVLSLIQRAQRPQILSSQVAVDLGNYQTRLTFSDRAEAVVIPSNMVIDRESQEIISMGQEAQEILGRMSSEVEMFSPVRFGSFTDLNLSKIFLQYCVDGSKLSSRATITIPPAIYFLVSPELTEVQYRAIKKVAEKVGARKIEFLQRPLIAALSPAFQFRTNNQLRLLIDCGFESTSIALLQFGKVVSFQQTLFGGKDLTHDIQQFLKNHHKLEVGFRTAEKIKDEGGRAEKQDIFMVIRGRDIMTSLPKSIKLNVAELRSVFENYVGEVMDQLTRLAEEIGPELIDEAIQQGFSLFGGMAVIELLKEQIETVFGTVVIRPDIADGVYHQGLLTFFELPKNEQKKYQFHAW